MTSISIQELPAVLSASSVLTNSSGTPLPLPLNLTGTGPTTIEPRVGSTAGSYSVVVNFSVPMTSSITATLVGLTQGQVVGSEVGTAQVVPFSGTASTVTINLTGVANAQCLDVHRGSINGTYGGNLSAEIPINFLRGRERRWSRHLGRYQSH